MTNIEKAKEMWKQGAIEINAVDKNGEALKQYDSVIAHDGCEWKVGCVVYSVIDDNFVAHFEDSWISFDSLNEVEKLNDVIAHEVLGWEKVETHWGKDGKPFHDMPIENFDAINYAAIILDQLNEAGRDVRVKTEDGYWQVNIDNNDYIVEEKFGIAVCVAAVNAFRGNGIID
ncbi:BC1872 family protein [Bacillus sp. C1]